MLAVPFPSNADTITVCDITHLSIIQLQGPQAKAFLQGQLTCNVMTLAEQQWCWGAHCDPTGKMNSAFRLYQDNDETLMLILPTTLIEHQIAQLQKYAVFHQVTITQAPFNLIGLIGTDLLPWLQQQGLHASQPGLYSLPQDEAYVLIDNPHQALLITLSKTQPSWLPEPSTRQPGYLWQQQDILQAYPYFEAAHVQKFIPQMLNLHAINGISFDKGCYIGQETIARLKYRGGLKRALYVLAGSATQPVAIGDQVAWQLETGLKKVGEVLQVVQHEQVCILTCVMNNTLAADATFKLVADELSHLTVQARPYTIPT
ncbi:MAG: folate-binding protein YgfZ [Shewanellaceae bacterium]|nr:folate-binding protein YgfZ [Shewanellaceae bacterium]